MYAVPYLCIPRRNISTGEHSITRQNVVAVPFVSVIKNFPLSRPQVVFVCNFNYQTVITDNFLIYFPAKFQRVIYPSVDKTVGGVPVVERIINICIE
jgi:hypothetical protein